MTPHPLTAALGPFVFGSFWMWLWGLAAVAPLIIHLWSRRKYHEVAFAAMEFLLAAMRKNARRIHIEQLILLAVRTLVLLLAAAAWMDLALWQSGGLAKGPGPGGRTHTVLVIDGSYSMAYEQAGVSLFTRAKQLAQQLVDAAARGDGFTLILMSDMPRVIVPEPAFDPEDVKAEIQGLTLPHGSGDLPATLNEVEKILRSASKKYTRLARSKVLFFTDLGQVTWNDVTTKQTRRRIGKLSKQADLVLVDLGQPRQDNLAITRLEKVESYVTVSQDVTFSAQIKNFGGQDRTGLLVRFFIDQQQVQQKRLNVAAGSETSVSLAHHFLAAGEHLVEVRSEDDPLPIDNHRWLSVPVRDSIRVLCINGKPNAAQFVAYALEPARSDRLPIRAEVDSESALLDRQLGQYDCIFLCNVQRFGPDEAGALHDYLQSGGGLVFFLGDQVQPESYNRVLGGQGEGQRILPARIAAEVPSSQQYRFDPRDYRHPIISPFEAHQRSGLLTTPVWKYFQLELYEPSRANIALWFSNGDPAIVEEPIGRGRSILVATAASSVSVDRSTDPPTPWTAMSSWPSFPPLVQEMLALAAGGRDNNRNVLVGQPLVSSVQSTLADQSLLLSGPGGQSERVRMRVEGEDSHWSYLAEDNSGVYRAQYGPPLSPEQWFAVNVDPRESDLTRIDAKLLPRQLTRHEQPPQDLDSAAPLISSDWRLFRYFLLGVLVLLLLETFLAWHFGSASA